jgi:PAS domain S-box-containing protein
MQALINMLAGLFKKSPAAAIAAAGILMVVGATPYDPFNIQLDASFIPLVSGSGIIMVVGGTITFIMTLVHHKFETLAGSHVPLAVYDRYRKAQDQRMQDNAETLKALYDELKPDDGPSMRSLVADCTHRLDRLDRRHSAVLDELDMAYFETDEHGELTYVNATYCDTVHTSQDEIKRTGSLGVVHADDRRKVQDDVVQALKSGSDFRCNFRNKYGDKLQAKGRVVKKADGTVAGWAGTVHRHG